MAENETTIPTAPPWVLTFAALVALAAYALIRREFVLPPLWGMALVSAHVLPSRMRRKSWRSWVLRSALYALVLTVALSVPAQEISHSVLDEYMQLAAQLAMVELALQYWTWPPVGGRHGVTTILFSGVVFVSAAHTYESIFIPWLSPLYIGSLILGFRALREQEWRGRGPRRRTWAGRAALVLALIVGGGLAALVTRYRAEIEYSVHLTNMLPNLAPPAVGLSEEPRLGPSPNIQLGSRRVLAIAGDLKTPHLRAQAFDTYKEGAWFPAVARRHFEPVSRPLLKPECPGERVRVTRLIDDFNTLCLPLHAAGIQPNYRQIEWSRDGDGPVRTGIWPEPPYTYDVVLGNEREHQGPLCQPLTEAYRRRCLAVPPEIDPRVVALGEKLTAGLSSPRERAEAIERYLLTTHKYSLDANPGDGDPVSNFILRKQAAHCEFFASAAVMLLRSASVPARYVTGFFAHERHGEGLLVRQRDGHAWAEAWIAGAGWITVDATPGDGRPDQMLSRLSLWARWLERLQDRALDLRDLLVAGGWFSWSIGAGVLAPVLLLLRWWQRKRAKRTKAAAPITYTTPNPALNEIATGFIALLRRYGAPCPAHLTWAEHLAALRADNAGNGKTSGLEHAEAFVRRYDEVRFRTPEDAAAVEDLRKKLRGLKLK